MSNDSPVAGQITPSGHPRLPPMPQPAANRPAVCKPAYLVRYYRRFHGDDHFQFSHPIAALVPSNSVHEAIDATVELEIDSVIEGFGTVADLYFDTCGVQPNNPPILDMA